MREGTDPVVSDEQVERYWRDGAVVLRALFAPDEIELLERGIEANLRAPSWRANVASCADDPGRFFEDFCCWQSNPAYERFIRETRLAAAARALMRSREVRLYHDHLLVKEAGTRQKTPWHQDQPYYNVQGRQNVSFWIPVDPVPRAWTLEFLAGSHRGPWLMPRSFMKREAKWFPDGSLKEVPDIDAERSRGEILGWALEPGDAVAFHMLALHAAAGVPGAQRRRVFSVRLLGDDMVHAPRRWTTSPAFPELEGLPAGAPMEHEMFPVLLAADEE